MGGGRGGGGGGVGGAGWGAWRPAATIERAGAADSEKITAALAKTSFSGVMGPFAFTAGRDPASAEGVVVLEMNGGKFGIAK